MWKRTMVRSAALLLMLGGAYWALAETYGATLLLSGAGVRTDRRPISIGFYDASVNRTFISWMGANSDAWVEELNHATGTWSMAPARARPPLPSTRPARGRTRSGAG